MSTTIAGPTLASRWSPLAVGLLAAMPGTAMAEPLRSTWIEWESIGVATQDADGTIVVQRRTPSGSGMVGDALVRYARSDPNYVVVARHIGPIPAGGSVFVRRFPE